jgi:hypothetical protein
MVRSIILALVLSLLAPVARGEDALPKKPESFDVAGHNGMVYAAPNPAEGKPWLWYMPTFKTIAFMGKRAYVDGFLRSGIAIARIRPWRGTRRAGQHRKEPALLRGDGQARLLA